MDFYIFFVSFCYTLYLYIHIFSVWPINNTRQDNTIRYVPLYPFFPLLRGAAWVVLAAVAGGHLEAVVLAQDAAVKRLDLDVGRGQVDTMHAGRRGQERLVRSRRANTTVYQAPTKYHIYTISSEWLMTYQSGNTTVYQATTKHHTYTISSEWLVWDFDVQIQLFIELLKNMINTGLVWSYQRIVVSISTISKNSTHILIRTTTPTEWFFQIQFSLI